MGCFAAYESVIDSRWNMLRHIHTIARRKHTSHIRLIERADLDASLTIQLNPELTTQQWC